MRNRNQLGNKWRKYVLLKNYALTGNHVPLTNKYTENAFKHMIKQYPTVVLKPWYGNNGIGVIKVNYLTKGKYSLHYRKTKSILNSQYELFKRIERIRGSKPYMIQEYLPLAVIRSSPVDFRVIVQRKRKDKNWVVTGKVAKVAGKGFFITNISTSRGKLLPMKSAIEKLSFYQNSQAPSNLEQRISQLALISAKRLQNYYPYHRIYGFDMGIDKQGKVWIIEANTFPALSHFRSLKNKQMYNRIIAFKK